MTPVQSTFRSETFHEPRSRAQRLILLFHGLQLGNADMEPLARSLAERSTDDLVVCLEAPHRCDKGPGWQWYSVDQSTSTTRISRIAQAMPEFVANIDAWQRAASLGPTQTILVGFSQGAIMALEAIKQPQCPVRHVMSIGGKFAQMPAQRIDARVSFIHGSEDHVISPELVRQMHDRLLSLGTPTSLDIVEGMGHRINEHACTLAGMRIGIAVTD